MSAVANTEMAKAWSGPEGEDWARDWQRYDRGVARYHAELMAAAGTPGDVLDVGCGNGQVARELAASGSRVVGIDLSVQMLARARQLAPDVTFVLGDAQVHPFPESSFDLVVSRLGAMFFGDRDAAFSHLAAVTRPGGRLLLLAWQPLADNRWMQVVRSSFAAGRDLPVPPPTAPSPFGLSDPSDVRALLTRSGWTDIGLTDLRFPMWFGADADDAAAFLGASGAVRGLCEGLTVAQQEEGRALLREGLAAYAGAAGVEVPSATWLIAATRPV